jgi:hypothetical protein
VSVNSWLTRRLLWLIWLLACVAFIAVVLMPLSTQRTRVAGVGLAFLVWFGLMALLWRYVYLRIVVIAISIGSAVFLTLPARGEVDVNVLRQDYLAGLRRYEHVPYYWGGESFKGIDCSGLVRRGLIDAAFCRGLRSLDPGLVRYSLDLWWHDCTANDLGHGWRSLTQLVMDTPRLNTLDHSKILPGDLAVTSTGHHVMAYIGDQRWIEADPGEGKVVVIPAPSDTNSWFHTQMTIVRWSILGADARPSH